MVTGSFGGIVSTAGIMAMSPITGGTLFSSLSLPSLHAHWLSLFLRTRATEGQARRHTLCSSSYAKETLAGLVPRAWQSLPPQGG